MTQRQSQTEAATVRVTHLHEGLVDLKEDLLDVFFGRRRVHVMQDPGNDLLTVMLERTCVHNDDNFGTLQQA